MAFVELRGVDFRYPVFDVSGRSLKSALMRNVGGPTRRSNRGYVEVQALSNVTLRLEHGDRVGLIGHNGSGKSTLLRLIAGLYAPTGGRMTTSGRVVPLIEKGLGINHDLNGHQNIELPMRLLGATSEEIRYAKIDIPEWTGLGDYMNLPVRTYSEGMKARLLFGLCTALSADILVMDEWLSAGDIDFVVRAQQRLLAMLDRIGIVVLASHSVELLRTICTRIVWLESGQLILDGDPHSVLEIYHQSSVTRAEERMRAAQNQ